MITRIKIDGFKSLRQTEMYLGPFTCIAGANAIGKSNFFDAILFLSRLADFTVFEAIKSIRSENIKHSNLTDIFYKSGDNRMQTMRFEVDMLIPSVAIDDMGQNAEATITSLRYIIELKLNEQSSEKELVEIVKEELLPMTQTDTKNSLFFKYKQEWLKSVLNKRRNSKSPFISTKTDKIKLHQDGNKGRTSEFIAEKMPRTLLSTVTAESPTAFLARQEMRNWKMLQFEPSAMRQPNSTYEAKNAEITSNGSNLPATLYRLHNEKKDSDIYQTLTNKLKELVNEVADINVDKDDKRDLLTLQVRFKDGLILPAQSLSDGTLRFLALAILNQDSRSSGLICLEEPENGINPTKITEMVKLLEEMATDTDSAVDEDNPLRQVIINSHSPLVVSSVADESLYLATAKEKYSEEFGKKIKYTGFSALQNTWKTLNKLSESTTLSQIISYLETTEFKYFNNQPETNSTNDDESETKNVKTKKSVAENVNQLKLKLQ